jgi:hypothetical protein
MQIVRPKLVTIGNFNDKVTYEIGNKVYEVSLNYIQEPYKDFPIDLDLFNILLSMLDTTKHGTLLDIKHEVQIKTLELFLNIVFKDLLGFNPVIRIKYYSMESFDVELSWLIRGDGFTFTRVDKRIPCYNLEQIFFYYVGLKRYLVKSLIDKTEQRLKKVLEQ